MMNENEQQSGQSTCKSYRSTLWVSLGVWFLIMTTFASFRERHSSELFESGGFDLQTKFRIISWTGLGLFAIYLFLKGRADLRLLHRGPLFWYGCFVVLALASTLYSPAPALTAYQALQHGVAILLVISLREHLKNIYLYIVAYIAVNWILMLMSWSGLDFGQEWICPSDAQDSLMGSPPETNWRFTTAFGHPSWISVVAAAGAVGLTARTRGREWLTMGPVILWLVLTTILTVSRTAIAGLAGGLIVVAVGRRAVGAVCLVGFISSLLYLSPDIRKLTSQFMLRGQSSTEFKSFTGRLPIYEQALQRAQKALPWGEGFQSGRAEPLEEGWLHTHNIVLESLTCLGLLGVLFTLLILYTLAADVVVILLRGPPACQQDDVSGCELAGLLVPLYAFCVLDVGFVTNLNQVCMLFLIVIALIRTILLDRIHIDMNPDDYKFTEPNITKADNLDSGLTLYRKKPVI